jgi:L-alanine-DL-glutamate epimerase-like enolase superfamily enzyme
VSSEVADEKKRFAARARSFGSCVHGVDGPLVKDGRIQVPDKPGLGVEPNPDYVRAHLAPGEVWWGRATLQESVF